MPRPLELRLPRQRRWPWIAIAASVVVHGLVLLFGWVEGWVPALPRRPPQLIVLMPPAEGPAVVPTPYLAPRPEGRSGKGTAGLRPSTPRPRPRPRPQPLPPPVVVLPQPRARPARPDTASAPEPQPREGVGIIRPGLADGRLWVRPLPLPPQELAQRLSKSHVQLVDSAVTAVVQGYLDSIALEPALRGRELPSWTREIGGKKFGLDSKNIYVAGLKIPAAVLALLPIPAGNLDQNRAYNHLMDLRSDLEYAAQRAENLEEFKTIIREIRERKEQEREFEQNQRTAPPPADTATP